LHAQTPPETLYVSQVSGASKVGEYDATTGATINANFITGLSNPFQLAVLGKNLFVVNQFNFGVDEYNATTGALIKANFVSGMQQSPYGLAFSGKNLFVVSPNTVGKYDATTGAAINANFITGLSYATVIAVSGNNLFVAFAQDNTIGEYDATTGAVVNRNFVTGLSSPYGLAIAPTQHVANDFNGDGFPDLVLENTTTGQHAIWFIKNGAFSSSVSLPTVPVQWRIVSIGDFNGDGFPDIALENTTTGQHAIWFIKNGAFSSSVYLPTVPVQWHIVNH
jgi:hypothetical protein